MVKDSKKLFEKMPLVDSETLSRRGEIWFLRFGFINKILAAAVLDFGFEICFSLNKNCLLRFEFSIWSGSVKVIFPFYPVPKLNIAKFFSN